MQKLRITFLAAVVAPIVASFSCGGSDNPGGAPAGSKEAGTSGSSNGTGGSSGAAGNTMGMAGTAGTMGIGGGPMLPPSEKIVLDPTCPGISINIPDGGFMLPDGGRFKPPPGLFGGDAGVNFKGCCDQTGVCGVAFQRGSLSLCNTPADIKMFGGGNFDAGPPKSCTYPKM